MTQQQSGGDASARRRNLGINIRELDPGTKLRTSDGSTVEIVSNPRDGIWLVVSFLESPSDESRVGTEDMLWVDDAAEVLS